MTGVPVRVAAEAAAAAAARKPKPPKPMNRAEMLRRIDELRRRDARKAAEQGRGKAGAVGGGRGAKPAKPAKDVPAPRAGGSREAGRGQGRTPSSGVRAAAPAGPQPYYGVEMKSVGGRWVQMHPESE